MREWMHDWSKITQMAEQAKRKMILNPEELQSSFEAILRQYSADRINFLKRAKAWEAFGKAKNAHAAFRKAKALLPMAEWKSNQMRAFSAPNKGKPKYQYIPWEEKTWQK